MGEPRGRGFVVRLIDRHGDHFIDTHGHGMPRELAKGLTVLAAMANAAEWLEAWCGDVFPWREQWPKRRRSFLRSEHRRRRAAIDDFHRRKQHRRRAEFANECATISNANHDDGGAQ